MCKMSTGVVTLFVAGLLGLACGNRSGLNTGGGRGGSGGASKGSQAGGGVAGGSAVGTGGVVARGTGGAGGSGGTIAAGGVGAGGTGGGSGGTIAAGGVGAGGTGGTTPTRDAGIARDAASRDSQHDALDALSCADRGVETAKRTPLRHRSTGATCSSQRAPGIVCNCVVPNGPWECNQDSDCTAGMSGRCLTGPVPSTQCSYDTCLSDSDCPARIPCHCRISDTSTEPNTCLTGSDCRVDSDCGPDGFCSPSACGPYHCHTASDTCLDDSDCFPAVCNFVPQQGHWVCGVGCGPTPP